MSIHRLPSSLPPPSMLRRRDLVLWQRMRRLLGRAGLIVGTSWLAACASTAGPDAGSQAGLSQERLADHGFYPAANEDGIQLIQPAQLGQHQAAYEDLWDRIRAGFAFPELDSPLVAEKERFYLQRPDYLQRMFARGARYLHHIVEEVEKRGMPTELALLPFVESAMNPTAMSSAKASGLWQFIPSTGRQYDLSQNWWVDNRRDVVESTRAALDYLQVVYRMHGNDWFLALASYNWGEGSVKRAVRNNERAGKPTDYLHLRMPTETRHYVPKLIAIKHIIQHADRLAVDLPALPNQPYFATIEKSHPIDMALAAEFAGMTQAEFLALNPAHNRPVISASRNHVLKIPADRVDSFRAAVAAHRAARKPFVTWHPHTLQAHETIEQLALRSGVSTSELLRANGIAAGVRVLPGTRLLVRNARIQDDRLIAQFSAPRIYQQVNAGPLVHRVRRGDTASAIARRYGLRLAELKAMNRRISPLKPGMTLTVRRSQQQTVMISEDGTRRVIRQHRPATLASASTTATRQSSARSGSTSGAIRHVSYTPARQAASQRSSTRQGNTIAAVRGVSASPQTGTKRTTTRKTGTSATAGRAASSKSAKTTKAAKGAKTTQSAQLNRAGRNRAKAQSATAKLVKQTKRTQAATRSTKTTASSARRSSAQSASKKSTGTGRPAQRTKTATGKSARSSS
ncbi:MAG: transglycosylase SLT domain-containing protein [Lautropia sp.]|nr:transglycosylase SLT domain-containing protein [Lautropia sp.]